MDDLCAFLTVPHTLFFGIWRLLDHIFDLVNTPIFNIKLHYGSEFLFTSLHYGSECVLYSPRLGVQEYWSIWGKQQQTNTNTHQPLFHMCFRTLWRSHSHSLLSHSFTSSPLFFLTHSHVHFHTLWHSHLHSVPFHSFTRVLLHAVTLTSSTSFIFSLSYSFTRASHTLWRSQAPTQHNTTTFLKCGISRLPPFTRIFLNVHRSPFVNSDFLWVSPDHHL